MNAMNPELERASSAVSGASQRYGLVLSGGGLRFATHAGVMAEMEHWQEAGKPWLDKFDVLVGTSAGALYSALYAAGYSPAHIALFAPLFAAPQLKNSLFDWNIHKLAAAFLRHDVSQCLGASSGEGVLTLLETVLSRGMPERLTGLYQKPDLDHIDDKALNAVGQELVEAWKRRKTQRQRNYHEGLLTFADCQKKLYLIGVNAYTGQKTVFGQLPPDPAEWDALDNKMYAIHSLNYINDLEEWNRELKGLTGQSERGKLVDMPKQFRRFENRLYHDFDADFYCGKGNERRQLPLALAVRSSVSLPVFFEPARIQRSRKLPGSNKHEQDFFLDGGVDDNFSLSVAADQNLGNCTHILGISLGNLGYRLPDPKAIQNVLAVLLNTTDYLGEAILDLQQLNADLLERHITIVNALPSIGAEITDTQMIGALVKEARGMAREFWEETHKCVEPAPSPQYPNSSPVPVDPAKIFAEQKGIRIWCSRTARLGTQSFQDLKSGDVDVAEPRLADILFGIPQVFYLAVKEPTARGWAVGYVLLFGLFYGGVTFVLDLLDALMKTVGAPMRFVSALDTVGWGWLLLRILTAVVIILVLRALSFWVWNRHHIPEGRAS